MIKEKHSHINADEEQRLLLEKQTEDAKRDRPLNIALTVAFFAFIYIFAILFWIIPDKAVSAEENRALTAAPKFTVEALTSGDYTSEFAKYMADQFPARNFFVGLKAAAERMLLRGGNNGVIFAKDGYLVKRFDDVDDGTLKSNIGFISAFARSASSEGIEVTTAVAGRETDVAISALPASYGSDSSDRTWNVISEAFGDGGTEFIDLRLPLRERFDGGEYVYYKTDHHWTSLGAYYAYLETAGSVGVTPSDVSAFTRETVTDSFFGTTWSSACAKWIEPDTIELFRYDGDADLVTDRGDERFEGLYDTSYLEEKDKYSVFLGGNAARIDVTSTEGGREKLLVIKDSFFHSLAPFFAKDCDLVLIDLRYYNGSPVELCREEGINKVLILLNVETLGEESGLRKLALGLN